MQVEGFIDFVAALVRIDAPQLFHRAAQALPVPLHNRTRKEGNTTSDADRTRIQKASVGARVRLLCRANVPLEALALLMAVPLWDDAIGTVFACVCIYT